MRLVPRAGSPASRWRALLVAGCALAALTAPLGARAADSVARVDAYLSGLKTLSASFVQVVRNKQGDITDRATGRLSISRPDRFRWDYSEPYEQVIVADGR